MRSVGKMDFLVDFTIATFNRAVTDESGPLPRWYGPWWLGKQLIIGDNCCYGRLMLPQHSPHCLHCLLISGGLARTIVECGRAT